MKLIRNDEIIEVDYAEVYDKKRDLVHAMVVCKGRHCHYMDSNEFMRVLVKLGARGFEVVEDD